MGLIWGKLRQLRCQDMAEGTGADEAEHRPVARPLEQHLSGNLSRQPMSGRLLSLRYPCLPQARRGRWEQGSQAAEEEGTAPDAEVPGGYRLNRAKPLCGR